MARRTRRSPLDFLQFVAAPAFETDSRKAIEAVDILFWGLHWALMIQPQALSKRVQPKGIWKRNEVAIHDCE
jgi:hypothetical protein